MNSFITIFQETLFAVQVCEEYFSSISRRPVSSGTGDLPLVLINIWARDHMKHASMNWYVDLNARHNLGVPVPTFRGQ